MRVLITNISPLRDAALYEELLRYVPAERQEKIARWRGSRRIAEKSWRRFVAGVWSAKSWLFPASAGARDRDGASGARCLRKAGTFRRDGGAF